MNASHHQLLYEGAPVHSKNYFIVTDTLAQKQVQINPDIKLSGENDSNGPIYLEAGVLYEKEKRSDIYFYTNSFLVDQYGNTSTVDKIRFTGDFGQRYIGNMLPLDYDFEDPEVLFSASYVRTYRLKEMNPGLLFQLMLEAYRGKVIYLNF
ncbi:MAG: hypothetical protein LBQ60_12800 [Bacteroidales bacterium]|nr:hypothetical protein [Bacteroidales bacterium]